MGELSSNDDKPSMNLMSEGVRASYSQLLNLIERLNAQGNVIQSMTCDPDGVTISTLEPETKPNRSAEEKGAHEI